MKQAWKIAALVVLLVPSEPSHAAEEVRELSWGMLMPDLGPAVPSIKSKGFLANAQPPGPGGNAPPPGSSAAIPVPSQDSSDSPWMSSGTRQRDRAELSAVVAELDGQRVRIGGYVVALDFDATKIKEFLLVPFVGACIHVPAPPPNQIIYVTAAKGFEVNGQFDPVYVTGTLKTARQFTGLAATGYTMEAEKVDLRKE